MEKEFQAEKEISIVEILRALLSKIVYLILALILGAAAGGIYGAQLCNVHLTSPLLRRIQLNENLLTCGVKSGLLLDLVKYAPESLSRFGVVVVDGVAIQRILLHIALGEGYL